MIDMGRPAIVAVSMAAAAVPGVTFAPEHIALVASIVSLVGIVAGLIAWIDRRIEKRIADHTEAEEAQHTARHESVMSEIRHVRELLRIHSRAPIPVQSEEEDR